MDSVTIVGVVGATLILIGFGLNQLRIWKTTSLAYDSINLVGSCLLILYSVLLESLPFLILNIVWALVSLKDVVTAMVKKD